MKTLTNELRDFNETSAYLDCGNYSVSFDKYDWQQNTNIEIVNTSNFGKAGKTEMLTVSFKRFDSEAMTAVYNMTVEQVIELGECENELFTIASKQVKNRSRYAFHPQQLANIKPLKTAPAKVTRLHLIQILANKQHTNTATNHVEDLLYAMEDNARIFTNGNNISYFNNLGDRVETTLSI